MKGILYYEADDAIRNDWFIQELIKGSASVGIEMHLQTDAVQPTNDVDFAFYRGRNFGLAKQWESQGLLLINRSEVNRIANDKLQTAQLAIMLGIPAIQTKRFQSLDSIQSYPVVIKTAHGHGGTDVHLCRSEAEAEELLAHYKDEPLVVQPYIEHGATDVRLYVIGNEVVAGVKRTGIDSFKANVALGGVTERFDPPAPLRRFAEKIAKALKSDYIGVDFLQNAEGVWLLNEIEDPVGARSLYETSELNVAQEVMSHIQKKLEKSL